MTHDPRRLADVLHTLREDHRRSSSRRLAAPQSDGTELLFLGNPHDACPRLLLLDPQLEPVDVVTWQVIRIHAEPGRPVAFPSYPELIRWVRVSRATIARSVSLLRLARWLLLYSSRRDAEGRFARNVYALVDEPVPLAEMLALDGGYIDFAEQTAAHRSAHVRRMAAGVLEEARRLAVSEEPSELAPVNVGVHLERRFKRIKALMESRETPAVSASQASRSQTRLESEQSPSGGRGRRVQIMNSAAAGDNLRVQDLNSEEHDLNSVLCSSGNRSTTTVTHRLGDAESIHSEFPAELSLTDSQRRVLSLRLSGLTPAVRQDVLDEGAARILAKRRTKDPVRSEFDYLARLCTLALAGEFVLTDAGERLRVRRVEREQAETAVRRARERSEQRRLEELAEHRERQSKKATDRHD